MMLEELPVEEFGDESKSVRDRFDWAVRQGNPYWLWPDVRIEGWQAALSQIEAVTRQVLTTGRARDRLHGRMEDISVAAFTSGMGPLLGHWTDEGLIDAEPRLEAALKLHFRHNTQRMERLAERAVAAVERLADSGAKVMVLKGMHTAYAYFPTPGTRPLSDIDLLIEPGDRGLAGEILGTMGYLPGRSFPLPPQQIWRMPDTASEPQSPWLVHVGDPWYIDLQTSLDRRYSAGAPMIRLNGINGPGTVEPWTLSPKGHALAPVAMTLHLACHAGCGLQSLTMLRLVELVLVIRKGGQNAQFSWDEFLALAQRTGTLASAYPALRLCEVLAPGTVPRALLLLAERQAPAPVCRVVRRLTPASCQQVLRCSLEERFMWTSSISNLIRQLVFEMFPAGFSLRELAGVFRMRFWRLFRGNLTKRAPNGF